MALNKTLFEEYCTKHGIKFYTKFWKINRKNNPLFNVTIYTPLRRDQIITLTKHGLYYFEGAYRIQIEDYQIKELSKFGFS